MKEFDNPINKHFINACELLAQEFCKTLDVSYHKDESISIRGSWAQGRNSKMNT